MARYFSKKAFVRLGKALAQLARGRQPLPKLPVLPNVPTQIPRAEIPLHPDLPKIAPPALPDKMVPTMREIPVGQGGIGPNREVILSDKMQELQRRMQFAHLFNEGTGPRGRLEHGMGKALWVLKRRAKAEGRPFTDDDARAAIEGWRAQRMAKKSHHLYLFKSAFTAATVPSVASTIPTTKDRASWTGAVPTPRPRQGISGSTMHIPLLTQPAPVAPAPQPGRLSDPEIDRLHDQMDFSTHTITDQDLRTPQSPAPTQLRAPVRQPNSQPKPLKTW